MNFNTEIYLASKINSFRKAIGLNDLTVGELYTIVNLNGIRPINGSKNIYSRHEIESLLRSHNSLMVGREKIINDRKSKQMKPTQYNNSRVNVNYYTDDDMEQASNELLNNDGVGGACLFEDKNDDLLYNSIFGRKIYLSESQIEKIKEALNVSNQISFNGEKYTTNNNPEEVNFSINGNDQRLTFNNKNCRAFIILNEKGSYKPIIGYCYSIWHYMLINDLIEKKWDEYYKQTNDDCSLNDYKETDDYRRYIQYLKKHIISFGRYWTFEYDNQVLYFFSFWPMRHIENDNSKKLNMSTSFLSEMTNIVKQNGGLVAEYPTYVACGKDMFFNVNDMNNVEDQIDISSMKPLFNKLHEKTAEEKHKATEEFRQLMNKILGQKLSIHDNQGNFKGEMPMAQYNALRYVDENINESLNNSYSDLYKIVNDLISNNYIVHGTNKEFEKFDPNFIHGGSRAKEGYGFYFGDLPYKPCEYGNIIYYIKKDDFNFLPLTTDITKNSILFNELFSKKNKINSQLYELNNELDNVRNCRDYDRIQSEIDNLKDEIFDYNKRYGNTLIVIEQTLLQYDIKNVGQLECHIPMNYVKSLSELFMEIGYDGYYHDHVYTVFNFDKLNQLVKKYENKHLNESLIDGFPDDMEIPIPELKSFKKKIVIDGDKIEILYLFGKNGMGLTCELDEIGKEIQKFAEDYFLKLDNEPHFDTCDDVYDFKVIGHKKSDDDKKNLAKDKEYILKRINEMKEKLNKKKIYLTEEQIAYIKENSNFVDPSKVLLVDRYLTDNFVRAAMPIMGEDGDPKTLLIVGMKGTDGNVIKNMTAKQLFYKLQDKFQKIYGDRNKRDKFLLQVMKDWYNHKISKDGLLSVNKY